MGIREGSIKIEAGEIKLTDTSMKWMAEKTKEGKTGKLWIK